MKLILGMLCCILVAAADRAGLDFTLPGSGQEYHIVKIPQARIDFAGFICKLKYKGTLINFQGKSEKFVGELLQHLKSLPQTNRITEAYIGDKFAGKTEKYLSLKDLTKSGGMCVTLKLPVRGAKGIFHSDLCKQKKNFICEGPLGSAKKSSTKSVAVTTTPAAVTPVPTAVTTASVTAKSGSAKKSSTKSVAVTTTPAAVTPVPTAVTTASVTAKSGPAVDRNFGRSGLLSVAERQISEMKSLFLEYRQNITSGSSALGRNYRSVSRKYLNLKKQLENVKAQETLDALKAKLSETKMADIVKLVNSLDVVYVTLDKQLNELSNLIAAGKKSARGRRAASELYFSMPIYNRDYVLVKNEMTFYTANSYCKNKFKGKLATMQGSNNKEKSTFMRSLFAFMSSVGIRKDMKPALIGDRTFGSKFNKVVGMEDLNPTRGPTCLVADFKQNSLVGQSCYNKWNILCEKTAERMKHDPDFARKMLLALIERQITVADNTIAGYKKQFTDNKPLIGKYYEMNFKIVQKHKDKLSALKVTSRRDAFKKALSSSKVSDMTGLVSDLDGRFIQILESQDALQLTITAARKKTEAAAAAKKIEAAAAKKIEAAAAKKIETAATKNIEAAAAKNIEAAAARKKSEAAAARKKSKARKKAAAKKSNKKRKNRIRGRGKKGGGRKGGRKNRPRNSYISRSRRQTDDDDDQDNEDHNDDDGDDEKDDDWK